MMDIIDMLNEESNHNHRRQFLRGALLATGAAVVSPSFSGQTDKIISTKYGLYGKLQAKAGKGKDLVEILFGAAKIMENTKGCILYLVGKAEDNPDGVYVFEVWQNKEDHDNSLKLPGIRELITRAVPILDGKQDEGTTLEILGGKGMG